MNAASYQTIKSCLLWAVVCAAIGASALGRVAATDQTPGHGTWFVVMVTGVWSLALLVRAWVIADRLGAGLAAVRTAVLNLVAEHDAVPPDGLGEGLPAEIADMLASLARYQGDVIRERQAPDRRLVAVLASLASGVVVVTDKGQVSLLNYPARELLGAERARVGTSVFAALARDTVLHAIARAQDAARPVEALFERLDGVELQGRVAPLADGEGAVIIFPPIELARNRPGVEFDLGLHDAPPVVAPLSLGIPLDELPAVILDTETTGLDVATDRIVSFGAVCTHGTRMFRGYLIDDVVNPGVPVPPRSTAIHGITDAMVRDGRSFAQVYADFERLARNRVVVGHNIPFDLTLMRHECARAGRPWNDRVFIDTLRLASLLNPTLRRFELENLSQIYQIDLRGRHTALGDAMVTAELFFRMIPRLQQQGFATLGDLLRFQDTEAVDVIAKQREAGWIVSQPAALDREPR